MNTQQDFIRIGTAMIAVDQIMSIGLLDDFTSICIIFKNLSYEPVVLKFASAEDAKGCFENANKVLCNPWS